MTDIRGRFHLQWNGKPCCAGVVITNVPFKTRLSSILPYTMLGGSEIVFLDTIHQSGSAIVKRRNLCYRITYRRIKLVDRSQRSIPVASKFVFFDSVIDFDYGRLSVFNGQSKECTACISFLPRLYSRTVALTAIEDRSREERIASLRSMVNGIGNKPPV